MNVNNVGANMGLNSVANLNQGASNIQGLGGLNVNTGGTSASEYEQSILDKPLYKDLGFTGIGGGPSRVPYDYNAGNIYSGANYTTNRDGTFTHLLRQDDSTQFWQLWSTTFEQSIIQFCGLDWEQAKVYKGRGVSISKGARLKPTA